MIFTSLPVKRHMFYSMSCKVPNVLPLEFYHIAKKNMSWRILGSFVVSPRQGNWVNCGDLQPFVWGGVDDPEICEWREEVAFKLFVTILEIGQHFMYCISPFWTGHVLSRGPHHQQQTDSNCQLMVSCWLRLTRVTWVSRLSLGDLSGMGNKQPWSANQRNGASVLHWYR